MSFLKTILPIAIGVGVGFAAPLVAPGLFAGAVFGAASAPVFSTTAALIGGSIASLGAGLLGAALQQRPGVQAGASQAMANAADPEYPRTVVYGERMVGWSHVWHETTVPQGPDDGAWYMLSVCIADHPIEDIIGVWINDDYLRLGKELVSNVFFDGVNVSSFWGLPTDGTVYVPVPHSPWNQDTSEVGRYLVTSAGRVYEVLVAGVVDVVEATDTSGNPFVSGTATIKWHMNSDPADEEGPSKGYHTEYQGERDGPPVWHFSVKFFKGGQTTPDTWFGGLSAKYSAKNRVGRGLSYANMIFVANPTISFGGQAPQVRFLIKGKNDIRTSGGTNAYATNAAQVWRDYIKWRLGLANTDFVTADINTAAGICDQAIPGHPSDPKYRYEGVVRWDEEPRSVIAEITRHMQGYWSERGTQITLVAGAPRAKVMDLTMDDMVEGAEPIYNFDLEPDEEGNTFVPHYIQKVDADGEQVWAPRPLKPITDAGWIANDGGRELRSEVEWNGATSLKRAKYATWITANQNRLETTLVGAFRLKCMLLELGDVVQWDDPDSGISMLMTVERVLMNYTDSHVGLRLREYSDAIYTPGAIDDEDLGKFPKGFGKFIPKPSISSVTTIAGSSNVQADGTVTANVLVAWSPVEHAWVQAGGSYRVRYRPTGGGDTWRSAVTDAHVTSIQIASLAEGAWDFQVKARTAGSSTSKWSNTFAAVVTSSELPMRGPPAEAARGVNLIANPVFDQRGLSWQADVGLTWITPPTAPAVGGAAEMSPYVARLDTAAAAGDVDLKQSTRVPIENPGMIYKATCWVHNLGTAQDEDIWKVLFYDDDDVFISGQEVTLFTFVGQGAPGSTQQIVTEYFQAPRGIGARSFRLELKAREGPGVLDHVTECAGMKCWEFGSFPAARKDTSSISGTGFEKLIGMRFPQGLTRPPQGTKWLVEGSAACIADASALTLNDLTVVAQIVRFRVDTGTTTVIEGPNEVGFAPQGEIQHPPSYFKLTVEDDPPTGGGVKYIYRLQADTDRSLGEATFEQIVMKVTIAGEGSTVESGEAG